MGDISPQEESQEKRIEIKIPSKLIERIEEYCKRRSITMDNFILDSVTARLQQANQERRKRQRL